MVKAIKQKIAILSSQKANSDALNQLEVKIQKEFKVMNEIIKKIEEQLEKLPEKTMTCVKD